MDRYSPTANEELPPGLRFRDTSLNVEDDREFQFTSREMQTLYLVICGDTRKQIAEKLDICLQTVDTYRNALFTKVRVRNAACLIHYAVRSGWISVAQIQAQGAGRAGARAGRRGSSVSSPVNRVSRTNSAFAESTP